MEERIGHYVIISELGRGGMGVVYKAHEESLNRFVALKVLGKHLSDDVSFVERFKREAQSAAALNHPNIVQVYSIDEFDGQHCFAMEYVEGTSIQQMIKSQGAIEPVLAARLILQTASGLGAAHAKGIFHRDIKPANLMVDERGLVKIADFGLALLSTGNTRLTATGMFMGTPGYLSPEQCLDQNIDQRTDIYSLGVTLYEMLTGVIPLNADSPLALLRQIIDVEPKDVGELRPEVPEVLRQILRKMMAKKPDDRYTNCAALINDLQSWLEPNGNSHSDSNAVIAPSVASPAIDAGIAPTVLMESNSANLSMDKEVPRSGARRIPANLLIAFVTVLILAGASYAAWQFIAADSSSDAMEVISVDTEIPLDDSSDDEVSPQVLREIVDVPAQDLPEIVDVSTEPLEDILVAEPKTVAKIVPEGSGEAEFETAMTVASAQAPVEVAIGTGVALVSIGESLLADSVANYVRQILERHGIAVLDGMAVPGVASMLENGGGAIESLLRPHARYLVFIRADYSSERELKYMGRYDTEYQARLNLETHDMLDGSLIGPPIRTSIGYTQLSVESKVEKIVRPKFGPIAADLKE